MIRKWLKARAERRNKRQMEAMQHFMAVYMRLAQQKALYMVAVRLESKARQAMSQETRRVLQQEADRCVVIAGELAAQDGIL